MKKRLIFELRYSINIFDIKSLLSRHREYLCYLSFHNNLEKGVLMKFFISLIALFLSNSAFATADTECSVYASAPGNAYITIGTGKKARTLLVKYFNSDGPFLVWVTQDGSYLKRINLTEMNDGSKEPENLDSKEFGILFDAETGKTSSSFLECI